MEIVLLYKFYIFSFLNLKRKGGKEERREGGREAVFSTRATEHSLLPEKWHAHLLRDGTKDATGHLKVTGLGFSIPVGQRPLFHN